MRDLLVQAMQDNKTGLGSSKRVNTVIATTAMSIAVVILAIGGMQGHDVAIAITGVSASLAGMCGYSYVGGKSVEQKRDDQVVTLTPAKEL